MQTFELDRLTTYNDRSLIDEILRVAALVPDGPIKRSEFDRMSRVHSSTLHARFGTWRKALATAGLEHRFDDRTEAYSRDDIVHALQSLSVTLGSSVVPKQSLVEHFGISDRPIRRLFGSYKNALAAAGLSQTPGGVRYTDEECFENLLAVWSFHGRQPSFSQMKGFPSKVGTKAYVSRWGSWRSALAAFVERANRDLISVQQTTIALPVEESQQAKHATSRTVPLGLRYAILKRDRFKCVLCGRSPATDQNVILHIDHILAWSLGGETVLENLRTLCEPCNLGKGVSREEM